MSTGGVNAESIAYPSDLVPLDQRISSLEQLGSFAGSFPTKQDLPVTKDYYQLPVTVNDFVHVQIDDNQSDNTTQYVVTNIDPDGFITFSH